jgi:hypothetical protein
MEDFLYDHELDTHPSIGGAGRLSGSPDLMAEGRSSSKGITAKGRPAGRFGAWLSSRSLTDMIGIGLLFGFAFTDPVPGSSASRPADKP